MFGLIFYIFEIKNHYDELKYFLLFLMNVIFFSENHFSKNIYYNMDNIPIIHIILYK